MSFSPRLIARREGDVRLLVDDGAAERGVLVAFTDRRGGVSSAPYDELNLALRVGDDPEPVGENRRRVAAACGFPAEDLVLARQVHAADLIEVGAGASGVVGEGDGLLARDPGPILGILTADCAPVVLAGESGVAVVHAGWRGVLAGVVEAGIATVRGAWGAWVGPSVHSCCYTVGPDVRDRWREYGLPVKGDRIDPGRSAGLILERAGIPTVIADVCTHCSRDHFSYRRDGVTGRQGAFVGIRRDAA